MRVSRRNLGREGQGAGSALPVRPSLERSEVGEGEGAATVGGEEG